MEGKSRRNGIRAAMAISALAYVVAAVTIHLEYVHMDADRLADGLSLPRGSLVLAAPVALGVLYFALVDVLLPVGRGNIEMIGSVLSRIRRR